MILVEKIIENRKGKVEETTTICIRPNAKINWLLDSQERRILDADSVHVSQFHPSIILEEACVFYNYARRKDLLVELLSSNFSDPFNANTQKAVSNFHVFYLHSAFITVIGNLHPDTSFRCMINPNIADKSWRLTIFTNQNSNHRMSQINICQR